MNLWNVVCVCVCVCVCVSPCLFMAITAHLGVRCPVSSLSEENEIGLIKHSTDITCCGLPCTYHHRCFLNGNVRSITIEEVIKSVYTYLSENISPLRKNCFKPINKPRNCSLLFIMKKTNQQSCLCLYFFTKLALNSDCFGGLLLPDNVSISLNSRLAPFRKTIDANHENVSILQH